MPLYEYECEACGHRFERIRKFSDSAIKVCPTCGKKTVHKLVSSPAIKFKGSGFYINDYAPKGASGSEPGQAEATAKSADTKEKSADAKGKSADAKDKSSPASSSSAAPSSGSTDTVSAGSSSKDS
jgi:putative FmdB family regulatory protein